MPKYLAPSPPDATLASYPMMPPSISNPANINGFNTLPISFLPSYISLVLLINCLSLTRLSNPFLSTTLNHVPLPTDFSADITQVSAPCDTAMLSCENLVLGLRCPVMSGKLYTAIVMVGCPFNSGIAINWCLVDVDSMKGESPILTLVMFLAHPFRHVIAMMISNILNIRTGNPLWALSLL